MYKRFLVLIFGVFLSFSSFGQTEYKVYSGFVYHFAIKTQWPASRSSGDFVIGVVGKSPITAYLKGLASVKKIGSRKIVVKTFNSVNEITNCHIVFLPKNQNGSLATAAQKTKGMNALLITESPGAAKKGAVVNFVNKDGRVRFELNKQRATSHGLKISSDLQKLALPI